MSERSAAYPTSSELSGKSPPGSAASDKIRTSNKMNEAYIHNSNGAFASEEEWAMEINDTLGLGTWFDTSGAPRDAAGSAAAAIVGCGGATQKSDHKASINHGPSSRRIKKKKGMPKRPLSAYNLFFQKERVRIYEQSSGRVSFEELGKTIGQRWKSLNDEDRREYDDLAEAEVTRYRQERDVYDDMRRKTLECTETDDDIFNASRPLNDNTTSWLTGESTQSKTDQLIATTGRSFKQAPYLFKPHDPDAPLPHTSLPPGMLVSLRDPDGREQSYKIEYKCFRMTRKDAEEYMDRLNEQMETGQVK